VYLRRRTAYQARQSAGSGAQQEPELAEELTKADSQRVQAFERVMLLADESVIEVAHEVNEALAVIDWSARGIRTSGLDEWRRLHERVFAEINRFHELFPVSFVVVFDGLKDTDRGDYPGGSLRAAAQLGQEFPGS
jgi:hypothetical protein